MHHRRSTLAAAAAVLGLAGMAATPATAAVCNFSSDPCTVDLGHATVTFARGAESYFALAEQINGSEGYFGSSPDFLSTFAIVHTAAGDGFSFLPQVYAAVGGGGTNGFHEVRGYFEFNEVSFAAKPGYRLDAVRFTVTGTRDSVDNGYVSLGLPVNITFNGSNFEGSGQVDSEITNLRAEFNINAAYLEGDDGTAVTYGTASAAFGSARFIAEVSPVPEPRPLSQLLLGAAVLAGWGWRVRRRG